MKKAPWLVSTVASTALVCALASSAQAGQTLDENLLQELKKLVEQQQQQLNHQAEEIAKLKKQIGGTEEKIQAEDDKEEVATFDAGKSIISKFENVDVSLYGHLNRGILWSDNGDSSDVFFVDNSNSQSRLGLGASIAVSTDFTVGTKIEYGLSSNATNDVNQNVSNDATSMNWNLRWADIFFSSNSLGKVSLGHGSTATDGTAEVDFSGTSVVTYSDVEALSGGQILYSSTEDTLTEVQVKNVFNNMDGLGRDDRLRYDSPAFAGFILSTSAVSGDGYDAAIRYSREFDNTKVAAAIAWANPGDVNSSVDDQYDGSIAILFGNGLNATFAGGSQSFIDNLRDDATTWYAKLGYRVDLTSFGKTSFSIDYGEDSNILNDNEKGKTWSIAAVQDVAPWGTEFYLAYRMYQLDAELDDIDDVNAILGGARVKF